MSEQIEDLIDVMSNGEALDAEKQFNDVMLGKLGDAMDAEKIRIANSIYNTSDDEQMELDLEESDLESEVEETEE